MDIDINSNINNLPDDMLVQIMIDLPLKDLLHTCRINRRVNNFCRQDRLWKVKVLQDFPNLQHPPTLPYREIYIKWYTMINAKTSIFYISLQIFSGYRASYNLQQDIDQLNRTGSFLQTYRGKGIKRGDIINFFKFQAIYDGTIFQPINLVDDKLYIPTKFPVIDEFPIRYWIELTMVSYYTVYVPFNPQPYKKEIIENFRSIDLSSDIWENELTQLRYSLKIMFNIGDSQMYDIYETNFVHSNGFIYTILIVVPYSRSIDEIISYLLQQQHFLFLLDKHYKHPLVTFDLSPYNPELTLVTIDPVLLIASSRR